jgi:hypothetical protein
MTGRLEFARRHGAPEYTHVIPNGFCLGAHSGRPERWSHDGTRWVAAEPSRYGFSVQGYDDDAPVVVRSVRIFPGVKWSASPNFSSPKKRKNGTHLLIGPWADKTGQAFNTGRVAEKNNTECRI